MHERLRLWIDVSSAAAIVISLVFVGMELRQNTAAVATQALMEMSTSINEDLRAIAESESLAEIDVKARGGLQNLTDIERRRYELSWLSTINTYEAAFLAHQKGVIDDLDYSPWETAICDGYMDHRSIFDGNQLNPIFRDYLQSCDSISQ